VEEYAKTSLSTVLVGLTRKLGFSARRPLLLRHGRQCSQDEPRSYAIAIFWPLPSRNDPVMS
jgi:hypothetical protein